MLNLFVLLPSTFFIATVVLGAAARDRDAIAPGTCKRAAEEEQIKGQKVR